MSKKLCALCPSAAMMFCDSDQASLCWDCDEKVHAANFLVAKHSRTLLCHGCQAPTPWQAAGPRLGRTVSLCHACANHAENSAPSSDDDDVSVNDLDADSQIEEDGDEDADDCTSEEEEDEGENQVVPLAALTAGSRSTENASSKRPLQGFIQRLS